MQSINIGVLDSGIGGLTVFRALLAEAPHINFHYIGDTARVPYGSKSPESIRSYITELKLMLEARSQLDALIIACNSATAAFGDTLTQLAQYPVLGVIRPGAERALQVSQSKNIALIGTTQTIRSGAYRRALEHHGYEFKLWEKACPLFVPLIEEGLESHSLSTSAIRHYLAELPELTDTMILGCTHYPLLLSQLQQAFPQMTFVDSASAIAADVKTRFSKSPQKTYKSVRHSIHFTDKAAFEHRLVQNIISNHPLDVIE